jgi:hypothetical protein
MLRATTPCALCVTLLALAALAPAPVRAQGRPDEESLFGAPAAPASTPAAAPTSTPAAPSAASSRDDDLLAPRSSDRTAARLDQTASSDPLKLGGLVYLRASLGAREGQPPSQWALSSPNLLDLYGDARPNDRVRAFVLGRLAFDPTVNPGAAGALGAPQGAATSMALDQLWVAFDVARTVFVTAGRQHVRWGTGRFWSPTDWLDPQRRDPLALFDARTGTTMLRLHLPWERMGWSFTAAALLEGASNADAVGKVAGAARAELVLGAVEVALDAIAQRGGGVKGGLDVSAGIWDLDVYADLALKTGTDHPLYELIPGSDPNDFLTGYRPRTPSGFTPALTVGATWSIKYSDEDTVTLGAEAYFDSNGTDDSRLYPYLLGRQAFLGEATFTPFYLGQAYGALFVVLPKPGRFNDTTLTFSTLGNLSDRSFLSRLDWSQVCLTYVTLEVYGQVHFGTAGGELRLGLDVPSFSAGGQTTPAIHVAQPLFDLGVNLRVKL